ncbi:MAG: hypothetical protein U5K54_16960 [Cytophagales bacterium]|nr:hypothetical protein [Cytophagales bacterium]
MSHDYFNNLYPGFVYNEGSHDFDFQVLTKRPQNNFQVDFGGSDCHRNISNIYLGMNYYYFNRTLTHASANFAAGNFYKSAQLKARLIILIAGQFYLEPAATFNSWDYLEGDDLVVTNETSNCP